MINKNIFKTLPSGTPKALVVVLAGKSLDDAASVAKELSKKGVRIVAFGAGDHADMKQLASIADSPLYAFKVPKLKYLPSMSSTVVGFIDKGQLQKLAHCYILVDRLWSNRIISFPVPWSLKISYLTS